MTKTFHLLLPALLSAGVVVTALPDVAEALPRHRQNQNNQNQYRPGQRQKQKHAVPELSVGAAAAALGLVAGGLLVITGRRRAKRS